MFCGAEPSPQGLAAGRFHRILLQHCRLPLNLWFLAFSVVAPTPALPAQTDITSPVGTIEVTHKFIREHGGEEHRSATVPSLDLSRHFTEGVAGSGADPTAGDDTPALLVARTPLLGGGRTPTSQLSGSNRRPRCDSER